MNVMTTAVFIVGQVAGCGVLALPKALNDTGQCGLELDIRAGHTTRVFAFNISQK